MQRNYLCPLLALVLAGLATPAVAGKGDYVVKKHPAKLEKIKGTELARVILTEKAVERTDIQFEPVREENVRRWLIIGGKVEPIETPPAVQEQYDLTVSDTVQSDPMRITVPMVAGWMGGTQTVRVLSTDDADDLDDEAEQKADEVGQKDDDDDEDEDDVDVIFILPELPAPDAKNVRIRLSEPVLGANGAEILKIKYEVEGNLEGLKAGDRVPVKYSRRKSGGVRKVVPYSAVIYDPRGNTWLYTSPEPLVFVRQPIVVDFIEGDRAVLKEGPAVGTQVVTAGAAELFGVENKIGL